MARRTHLTDRYPRFLVDDVEGFMSPTTEVGGWVVDGTDGELAGHVALHDSRDDATARFAADVLGTDPAGFAVLARLVVSPGHRGRGLGRGLVEIASAAAVERGLTPVLDVIADAAGPIALYERLGWRRLGAFELVIDADRRLDLLAYLGPA